MRDEHREVHVKPKTYRPRNAELEEPFIIRKADGIMTTPEELVVSRWPRCGWSKT